GEAENEAGDIKAAVIIEATVQRFPEFVDASDPPYEEIAGLKAVNENFGRRYRVISMKTIPTQALTQNQP
ncbi:MAG: hypothetical protein ACQKBY_11500, partial [Verrucomicrobiales bacterium]